MKRMLINATQAEERRMAVVDGQKLLDFEIEIEGREQRKGNIYKAVVTRVEPSLEACFVDYGEDRHGFLPLKEINKIYFNSNVPPSQAKIQEVISEGLELLVQVDKEERGNKGAALTTNISLAGRYIVLMPHNQRGGGVSRRIEGEDRAELKEALEQLDYPKGMSVIARTAGIGRDVQDLQWDLNYLLKLWQAIEDAAKGISKDSKEKLIYQEGSLVIRTIRDYFNHDIGDILIDTKEIYDQAKGFMSYVMPEYANRVKLYTDDIALFSRFQIEHQIESAYSRTVQLPSGGAIVIDQTEALVAVDVNSARSIKGSHIEDTATRTNMEAAEEVARQMRLRDLGGLIVIDFIDMEDAKNRRDVENRLRDCLRQDRARVQFGSISKFGLLEMSRQRLRPALNEGASIPCPRCGGSGHIRDTESSALQILRIIQEESIKDATAAIHVQVPVEVASFLLNEKRNEITKIELAQRIDIVMIPNKQLETPNYRLERIKHEDSRLENLVSSYKLTEEIENPSEISRKPRERTNKQEPLIKAIVHDGVAPSSLATDSITNTATSPAHTPHQTEDSGSQAGGLFGWMRKWFTKNPTASTPSSASTQTTAERSSEEKRSSTPSTLDAQAAKRPARNERNKNRDQSDKDKNGDKLGNKVSASTAGRQPSEDTSSSSDTAKDKRVSNNRRGRPSKDPRSPSLDTDTSADVQLKASSPEAEGSKSSEAAPRSGRGKSRVANNTVSTDAQSLVADKASLVSAESDPKIGEPLTTEPSLGLSDQSSQHNNLIDSLPDATQEKPAKRERKSRDRYGRDRRERSSISQDGQDVLGAQSDTPTAKSAVTGVDAPQYDDTPPSLLPTAVTESGTPGQHQPVTQTPEPVQIAAPVTPFQLPVEALEKIAASSGLEWVNSNPARVQEVQAAIAAEPQPTRTPRVRPAPQPISSEPLIMVETQLRLQSLDLPFSQSRAPKD